MKLGVSFFRGSLKLGLGNIGVYIGSPYLGFGGL